MLRVTYVTCYTLHLLRDVCSMICYVLHVICYLLHSICYLLHVTCITISSSGFHTRIEPADHTPVGIRYPNIIALKGNDTRICADKFVINEVHRRKVEYYTNPPFINGMIMRNSNT